MPCKKYNTQRSMKFRRSLAGRLWKLVVVRAGVCGVTGGFSSRVKSWRDIRREAWSEEDSGEVSLLRISMLVFMSPLAWPLWFWPVASLRVGLERRFVTFRFMGVWPLAVRRRKDLVCGRSEEEEEEVAVVVVVVADVVERWKLRREIVAWTRGDGQFWGWW